MNAHKPGNKHTPLGWIPENWEVKEIGEIGKLSSGTTPFRQRYDDFFLNGTIPWVKTTDLNNSSITMTEECVTEKALNDTSLRVYPINSILVAMYGGFNQIGRTGILKVAATVNQALTVIQLFEEYVPKYILECLNHRVGYWKNFAGSSRKDPNITSKDVADFPIIIATHNEQQKIATILSTWDEAIQKILQLIEQLKQRNNWLSHQLLSGKTRLNGYSKEWDWNILGDLIREREIITHNEGENEILTSSRKGLVYQREYFNKKVASVDNSGYKIILRGDFTYRSMSDDNTFVFNQLTFTDKGLVSPAYSVFYAINMNDVFLKYLLNDHSFKYFINNQIQGGTRTVFRFSSLKQVKMRLPSQAEQKEIANALTAADFELKLYEQQLAAVQKQKKGLMQKLLSGEVRVKV